MKRFVLVGLPVLAVASAFATHRPAVRPAAGRVPVVVELFTSEGCSSCPAADAALRELETAQSVPGVEVIALGQHVDYWNRLGWKDPFSSAQFTDRQRAYAAGFGTGSYTPQAVVNGQFEFVGSNRPALAAALAKAAQGPRATVRLARAANAFTVQVADLPAGTPAANVLLAITETGLSTQVGRGENSGRLLRHAAVVRALRPLGPVGSGLFAATAPLALRPEWKVENLHAVVLVQDPTTHHIVGAASLPLAAGVAAN